MQRLKLKSSRLLDANFRLPYDLQPTLLAMLTKWESCPKTDYLLSQVMTKFHSSDTAPHSVRRTRAINKWLATERNNEATNERLMSVSEEYNILPRVTYRAFMSWVSAFIAGIIGEVVPEKVLNGSFSGGASTSRQRTSSHPSTKYVGEAHVTERAREIGEELIGSSSSDLWVRLRGSNILTVVEGNVLFTVPKNSDIDRCACKEPDINMYLQKGTGNFIRNCLHHAGINLNDQSRNANLAREGSLTGKLATLDLSSASDSVCREFVFQALPVHWFTWLDTLRSPVTIIDGQRHENEMFSSMGNGFTFELESLLFFSVAKAVAYFTGTSGVISVYGDDIIIPVGMYHELIFVLSFLGFETNTDKSFGEGPFRESCGGHYHHGRDVTPFFIRKPITHLVDAIHIANQLRKWGSIEGLDLVDCEVEEAWKFLASFVPPYLWGGHDYGDPGRLVSLLQPNKPKRLKRVSTRFSTGIGGYLHWHDSGTGSQPRDLMYSVRMSDKDMYRLKPIKWPTPVVRSIFISEIGPNIPSGKPEGA